MPRHGLRHNIKWNLVNLDLVLYYLIEFRAYCIRIPHILFR